MRSNPTSPPTEIAFGTGLFEAAIQSVGFYPFYHYTGSDHRELEFVFDRQLLFQGGIANTWHKRTLNPRNKAHTTIFIETLKKLHKKSDTLKSLTQVEKDLKSDDQVTRSNAQNKACNIATRALLEFIHNANKKAASPIPSISFPWSPELKMSKKHVQQTEKEARQHADDVEKQRAWEEAKKEYDEIKGNAGAYRRAFLDGRIEETSAMQKCSESAALKQILDSEVSKELHAKNLLLLKGQRKATMNSILVPNGTIGSKLGWTSVTDTIKKEEIALRYNERHLMSSNISPFAYGPLSELIGNDAHHSDRLTQGLTEEQMDEIVNHLDILRQL